VSTRRRVYWLVVFACGLIATGPALVVAAVAVRLAGLDGSSWSTWLVLSAATGVLTFVAGLLSKPLDSRLTAPHFP
jgi:hypothetical protein